jgi:hypothetical protein
MEMNLRLKRYENSSRKISGIVGKRMRVACGLAVLACASLVVCAVLRADAVPVRFTEGETHGFLVLQDLDGKTIADGDLTQIAKGVRVTDRMTFHFKDGSLYDETFVFTQRATFHLVSDHLIQKGPAFKKQMDTWIDVATGEVTTRYTDDDGKEKVVSEHVQMPADLANGIVQVILKDLQPGVEKTTVSMVVATPKPRIVKLVITPATEESFSVGGETRKASHFVVKIDLGGAAGVLAPIFGKEPPDTNVWFGGGDAPVFLKSEGPLFNGGPIWRIAPVFPTWPQGGGK